MTEQSEPLKDDQTSVRIRLGPTALDVLQDHAQGKRITGQLLDEVLEKLRAGEPSHRMDPPTRTDSETAILSDKIDKITALQVESQNVMISLRYLISLLFANESAEIREIERRITSHLDRIEIPLERAPQQARPDLREMARTLFGEARSAEEIADRETPRNGREKER